MVDADLHVRLSVTEARGGEVQQREVVLAREVFHLLGDRLEAAVDGVLGAGVIVEELRQFREEALGVHCLEVARHAGEARLFGGRLVPGVGVARVVALAGERRQLERPERVAHHGELGGLRDAE